jgi:radical SAM protein with 4Fe4S-binding SPASM domain
MNELNTIYFHVTKQCNFQCTYCYFESGGKMNYELSSAEINKVVYELPVLEAKRLIFTGGEPLLRHDLFDIARRIKNLDIKLVLGITTNGSMVNYHNSRDIAELFDEIRISIDGFKDINDLQRGHSSFDKAINAFELVIKAGGNPSAFITATSINIGQLKEFMNFLFSLGICKIHISPLKLVGRSNDESLLCNREDLNKKVEEFYNDRFGLKTEHINTELCNCGVGQYISINPDGSVFPCHVLSFPEFCIGNIRKESLASVLKNSILMDKLRKFEFKELVKCNTNFSGSIINDSCLGMLIKDKALRNHLFEYLDLKINSC